MCRVRVPKHHGLVVVASVVGCTASVFDTRAGVTCGFLKTPTTHARRDILV